MARRFPPPLTAEEIAGGFKVLDANGQALAYIYWRTITRESQRAMLARSTVGGTIHEQSAKG